jgi:hypothetical protein
MSSHVSPRFQTWRCTRKIRVKREKKKFHAIHEGKDEYTQAAEWECGSASMRGLYVSQKDFTFGPYIAAESIVPAVGPALRRECIAARSSSRGRRRTRTSLVAPRRADNRHAVAAAANIRCQEVVDAEQIETKTEEVETKTKAVESKTERVDKTAEHRENADCVQLVHKEATLCQKALRQDKHESVYEMKERQHHHEGKQACDAVEQCETIPSLNNQATVSGGVSLEDKLETSSTAVNAAAPVCEQTIGAHVLNYTHHKSVELWYSTDGWQTQQVKPLSFQSRGERVGQALHVPGPNSCNVEYEYWEVNLGFEVGSQDIEYVIKYESSYGVYWANNSGKNFKIHKSCPQ